MDNESTHDGTYHFSYKTWWQHTKGLCSHPVQLFSIAVVVFTAVLAMTEAPVQFWRLDERGWLSYVVFAALSLSIAVGWQVYHYVNTCPPGLEGANPRAQRIAHLQRPKWEFELAKALLAQRLAPVDRECRDVLDGHVFVTAAPPSDVNEYVRWLGARPTNLLQMVEVGQFVLLHRFAPSLMSTEKQSAKPEKILAAVESLERMYRETVYFERLAYTIIPPEEFAEIHRMQLGWAEPMRDAILQMFQFLQHITDTDPDKDARVDFTLEFKEPPNVEEFCTALDKLEERLPDIIAKYEGL